MFFGVTKGFVAWQIDFQRACPGKEERYIRMESAAFLQLEEPISSQTREQF